MDIEIVREYAYKAHSDTNHLYDKKFPYSFHLGMVEDVAIKFIHLIPFEDRDDVIAGCIVHDVMEDARQRFNDVKRSTTETIAGYSYALQNEKGKTRPERANEKYYKGIRAYKHATFVKLCDRFANAKYSKENGSSMFKTYLREMPEFKTHLFDGRYKDLWDELEKLFSI
jgi:(p)ppGpp synthase/HD superfamily hydrolase